MKNVYSMLMATLLLITINNAKAQTTAMQFAGVDCNGNAVDLFADLNAGKAVILHFYMPNCGSCPPPAQKIQAMANKINATHPGMVKGYAFPFQNSTTCAYSSSWVTLNNLSALYAPMDSGATQVAYYGGFGMPTVVLLGGTDHRIMFSTLSFISSDTTIMRDSILAMLNTTGINQLSNEVKNLSVYPNPADDIVNIKLELQSASHLLIDITDLNGKQMAIIADDQQKTGLITKSFNTAMLPSGNYLVRINVNGKTTVQNISVKH